MKIGSIGLVAARALVCGLMSLVAACGGGGDVPVPVPTPAATLPSESSAPALSPAPVPVPAPPIAPAPSSAGISLVAGAVTGTGNLDGLGGDAYFNRMTSLARERDGSLLVADAGNFSIRRVSPEGLVSTVVGSSSTSAYVDGPRGQARLMQPIDIVATADGGAFFVDGVDPGNFDVGSFERRLRHVNASGTVTSIPLSVKPVAVGLAPNGEVILASFRSVYRWNAAAGLLLIAGDDSKESVPVDGAGAAARFRAIMDIAVSTDGTIYVCEQQARVIRRIRNGVVDTFAGTAFSQDGPVDGLGASARFTSTLGQITTDAAGNVWVVDHGVPRRISPEGQVTSPVPGPSGIAAGVGIATEPSGAIVLTQYSSLERVASDGVKQRIAGHDVSGGGLPRPAIGMTARNGGNTVFLSGYTGGPNSNEYRFVSYASDGTALGTSVSRAAATGGQVTGFTSDSAGNLYVSTIVTRQEAVAPFVTRSIPEGGAIVRVAPDGTTAVVADWPKTAAERAAPSSLIVGGDGALYFHDVLADTIVRWSGGRMQVLAGLSNTWTTQQRLIRVLSADASGQVSLVTANGIFRVRPDGTLSSFAGQPSLAPATDTVAAGSHRDGQGVDARFKFIRDAALDRDGNLFVADEELVRMVTPNGRVTTVVGQPGYQGLKLGPLPGSLGLPVERIAVTEDGSLLLVTGAALVRVRLR